MSKDSGTQRAVPSAATLYWSFTKMSLQAFGGVLPLAERMIVAEKNWLTKKEFVEMLGLSQTLPGPNIINLSLILGDQFQGPRGAFAAVMGCLSLPILIVSALAIFYSAVADHPVAQGALQGMSAVSVGLVIAMGLRLLGTQRDYKFGWLVMAGSVVGVGLMGLKLTTSILVFGLPSVLVRYWQLRPRSDGASS
jgi:chromate transporter